jgi:RNA polymerase sigma-70 factor (ECF subfamily)
MGLALNSNYGVHWILDAPSEKNFSRWLSLMRNNFVLPLHPRCLMVRNAIEMFDGIYDDGLEARSAHSVADDDLARLLERCAARDRLALRKVYDAMSPLLFGIALRLLRNRGLAEDTLQDAFLQIWRNANQYDPARGSARAWMIGVLRYRALDRIELEARHASHGDVPDIAEYAPVSVEDRSALSGCLAELPEASRHCVLLAFIEGMSHPEIAAATGKPLGTVKSWISRALAALKQCLER